MEDNTQKSFKLSEKHDTIDAGATLIAADAPAAEHAQTQAQRPPPLDISTSRATDISKGEKDMSNPSKLRQRAELNGKQVWLTGTCQQDLFDAYLDCAIEEGVVLSPNEDGSRPIRPDTLFKNIAERWFKLYKVGMVRETTLTGYKSYLNHHVLPYFGEMDVRNVTIDDVQIFLNSKAELSRKTIEEIWLVVNMVFDVALDDGIIARNPAKSKRLRNPSKKKKVARIPLTTEEAEDIEAHLMDIPNLIDRRYVALLLFTPARCEDIRGIQMKDIDRSRMLIRIERSVTYANSNLIIGDPKTDAGIRDMLMLPKLWEVLELTDEELSDPDAYLVHMRNAPHEPLTFQANRRLWERVKKAINVYGKTPHCFRHTFATRAYRMGVSEKTLQTMGGWADLKTMQNVYIHTQHKDFEEARKILTVM